MTQQPTGRFWPWFIGALLLATAAAQGVMLYAATHDPTFSVEPDYYAKAIAWDSTMASERESSRLGWHAEADIASTVGGDGKVSVTLADSAGAPVAGATVAVVLVSNLDAEHPRHVSLAAAGAGRYEGAVSGLRRGIVDVRVAATAGPSRFQAVIRKDLE
jgi:nitrogen fixation protein FixH